MRSKLFDKNSLNFIDKKKNKHILWLGDVDALNLSGETFYSCFFFWCTFYSCLCFILYFMCF